VNLRHTLTTACLLATVLTVASTQAAFSPSEAKDRLQQLEQRSRTFYDLLERGERDRASVVWPDLHSALARLDDELHDYLEEVRQEVMDRDGDIEELYRSTRWREPEIMSLIVTYHLAWVRYQGAQLTSDAGKKKTLLRQAAEGFSQFLLVNEVPEIYAESLYGRGLAFMDLGEYAKAIEDLQLASNESRVAIKARSALEEARRRAGGGKERSPELDPEQLLARLADILPRAAAGETNADKDALDLARGLAARGGNWSTRVERAVAEKLGDGRAAPARSSFGLFLLAQLLVDRGRCSDVQPLVEAGKEVLDATRARYRPELLFLVAGCRLNAGDSRSAAEAFGALVHEFPEAARAREAAYYRVRALAVLQTDDATFIQPYEEALLGYLTAYPKSDTAGEVRFLFAELRRNRGNCSAAAKDYAQVTSGPYATRARLGALECRTAGLTEKSTPAEREGVLNALRAFVHDTPARGADEPLVGRAGLIAAVVALGAKTPNPTVALELLKDFESKYARAPELIPRALLLRAEAHVAARAWQEADTDLTAYLAKAPNDADRGRSLSRLGRKLSAVVEQEARPAGALALAQRVYGALVDGSGEVADRLALAGLDLRAGDASAARRNYDAVLAADPQSAEALRGAARAATAVGDRNAARDYWRRVVDGSTPGGTAWYEARLAQVQLLVDDGKQAAACDVARQALGRASSVGGDQLEGRLRELATKLCR